ncbi:MAG: hydroxyacylglutathione hydrolase [Thermoleophilaceae bacterium]|nr:hydroxyacylglutathione hydrolase [Thermoleophilaceae bacterium]
MRQLADDLWLLRGVPRHAINVYLAGDVLIDAATRRAGRRILSQIEGRAVTAHALTHAHPDHQGASKEVCDALGIPLWCHDKDADAMERGTIPQTQPDHPINRLIARFWLGPPYPVARRLEEGDEVAGFTVLHVPGHSAGHVAYWRESDRTLIVGDVIENLSTNTGLPGLHEPASIFTPDPKRNRESVRRLVALEPELVCFGHGKPLRDPDKLRRWADGLG